MKKILHRSGTESMTLIEMLVVMGIIVLLAGLLIPAISSAREKARSIQCASNMRQLGVAFRLYSGENKGMYPRNWVDNSFNWESMLVDNGQGGIYLSTNNEFRSLTGGPIIRLSTRILCPTTCKGTIRTGDGVKITITDPHDQWGYCYNSTRFDISYTDAYGWPWNLDSTSGVAEFGANVDILYANQAKYIALTDGNGANYNSDNDWNAFTGSIAAFDWPVVATHKNNINALFMDGHVQSMSAVGTAQTDFNRAWYGGIPTRVAPLNPYRNE